MRLFYKENGTEIDGKNPNMRGDCSKIFGDCTFLAGDVSGLRGDCTNLRDSMYYVCNTPEDFSDLTLNCTGLVCDCSTLIDYKSVLRKHGV